MDRIRATHAQIDLRALVHNFQLLDSSHPHPFMCPMIKANGYGHGDIEIAGALIRAGAKHLGVGLIEEGVRLRDAGVTQDIIFFGVIDPNNVQAIIDYKLTPVISGLDQLEWMTEAAKERGVVARGHLKLDTGMHRFGIWYEQATQAFEALASSGFKLNGVMTHLAEGEDIHDPKGFTATQLARFEEALVPGRVKFPGLVTHVYNSAGVLGAIGLSSPGLNQHGARPGISLFGYSPIECDMAEQLRPVMHLKSKVVHIQKVAAGDGVSYGRSWTATRDSVIGILPMGYADGLPRGLSNKAKVLVQGELCPLVGNVTMDNVLVDLTNLAPKYGAEGLKFSEVTFFGYDEKGQFLSAHEWAQHTQSITWEILTRIGERVPREFVGG